LDVILVATLSPPSLAAQGSYGAAVARGRCGLTCLIAPQACDEVSRLAWKGDGHHVFIWRQANGVGFIGLSQYHGHMVEWQARDADLLADDWVVHRTQSGI
jgi:Protein of unknown function (DUF2829)